jgi:putative endonuclease
MSVSTDPRRALGALGERLAAEHLARAGYVVLARNYRTRFGEIDIIAADSRCLVFCEVKTRVAGLPRSGPSDPLDAIGPRKRRQLRAMAREWLAAENTRDRPHRPELRFDAIGIVVTSRGVLASLDHLMNAF